METPKDRLKEYFEKLKSCILYVMLIMCGFVPWYIGMSFISLNLNVLTWTEEHRLVLFLIGSITSLILIGLHQKR
jgi:hypothetical protein